MGVTRAAGIKVDGLTEFRRALRQAEDASVRELTAALKDAGRPALARIQQLAPVGTRSDDGKKGQLRKSYKLQVSGTRASIVSSAPYAAGAEWGLHGKWKGFLKYPGAADDPRRGRFAWKAVLENADQIVESIQDGMREIAEIHGWARP